MQTKDTKAGNKYLYRDPDEEQLEISRSHNSFLYTPDGKKYIDFVMGWSVGALGWGMEEIRKKTAGLQHPVYVVPDYQYQPWSELAQLLAEITPGELERSVRTTGGTESVEAAMQMAMVYTGRSKFLSIEGAYHGNSIAALSIGKKEKIEKLPSIFPGCYRIAPPLDRKAADKAETKLKRKDIAAFIMEPVIMNLAVLVPEPEFMERIADLCRHYGTLLVMDEVMSGFCRTGLMFASEHYNIQPDIMTLAKGISSGYAGIGAAITTGKIARKLKRQEFSFYSTFGWHPIGTAAAIANIHYLVKNQAKLMANISDMETYFTGRLQQMQFKYGAAVRSKGLAIAIDVNKEKYAESIRKKCMDAGLLIQVEGSSLILLPALNVDKKTAVNGLDILEETVLKDRLYP